MDSSSILIIDDNQSILKSLEIILAKTFHRIDTSKNPNNLHHMIQSTHYDAILLDMNFSAGVNSGNEGIFWLKEILKIDPDAVVILITAYGDIELSVKAMKLGATDFILKPWDNEKLIATLKSAIKLRKSRQEVKKLKSKKDYLHSHIEQRQNKIIGTSKPMLDILATIHKVSSTDANILILGENGTGKELIAREVHNQSLRKDELFVSIDLGSLSETLFESELFGHIKGSFTDAKEDRVGRIEAATGGTLFLDEIGNLSMSQQSKLLSMLQNREIVPLGSNKAVPIDIRLICATNKPLASMIKEGSFREDLLYRINTIQVDLPPLRDRDNDIISLSEYFLLKYSKKYNKPLFKLNQQAADKLLRYKWPGNIRELEHTMEKVVILSNSEILKPNDFVFSSLDETVSSPDTLNLEEVEKDTVLKALKKCRGNISHTAEELGVTRKTLYKKIEKYGL